MNLKSVLENWARWAKDKYQKQHCASIEHRFRSPQEWGDWENAAPGQMAMPTDVLEALQIQKAISYIARNAGPQYAWALTYRYCYPSYDKWAAARHCKVYRPERLEKLTNKAELMVKNTLHLVADMRYIRDCNTERARISDALQGIQGRRQGRVFSKILEIA